MNIRCPHCGKDIPLDETDYNQVLKQIKDHEFNSELEEKVKQMALIKESEYKLALSKAEADEKQRLTEKNSEIEKLKAEIKNKDTELKLAITQAVADKDKTLADREQTINVLKNALSEQKTNSALEQEKLVAGYKDKLKDKDAQIALLKDYKVKLSTKMVGEDLEKHCETEFNKLRATGFKGAYFEKDNDSKEGSKGDYIFRDYTPDGIEYISIMFEMKNESDTTSTKHKNEDFLEKLDKDRRQKKCEYAVLVTMLEPDNDYYNEGIVDLSYRYEKMYAIRPQFFIPMITLIRNLAQNSAEARRELAIARDSNIDLAQFEEDLNNYKTRFANNCRLSNDRFEKAIAEIDKTILALTKAKEDLLSSDRNLRLAQDKLEDITVKKLVKGKPTLEAKYNQIKK